MYYLYNKRLRLKEGIYKRKEKRERRKIDAIHYKKPLQMHSLRSIVIIIEFDKLPRWHFGLEKVRCVVYL